MKIAFDFGGVLDKGGRILEIALLLQKAGAEIHLITAVADEAEEIVRATDHLARLRGWGLKIPDERVHICVDTELAKMGLSQGGAKVMAMVDSGCVALFDDAESISKEVQKAGFLALRVMKGGK